MLLLTISENILFMRKIYLLIPFLFLWPGSQIFAQLAPLTVEKIMRDPKWMGNSPTNFRWSLDSKYLFFDWNPQGNQEPQVYRLDPQTQAYELSTDSIADISSISSIYYNHDNSLGAYAFQGDLYIKNFKEKSTLQLTQTMADESVIGFSVSGDLFYQKEDNIYELNWSNNTVKQLTNFQKGPKPAEAKTVSPQSQWLKTDQQELFEVFKEPKTKKDEPKKDRKTIHLGDAYLAGVSVSADGKYVSYRLIYPAKDNRQTIVPNFITQSGYVEDLNMRTKVGNTLPSFTSFVYGVELDTAIQLQESSIPGIKDLPKYLDEYPKRRDSLAKVNENRSVQWGMISWSPDGKHGVITARSQDNKDLWLLAVNPASGELTLLDRQHDDAWIAGPGIARDVKWIDSNKFYFQSEESGYAHLYTFDLQSAKKQQLTQGKWEVQSTALSEDKKHFYIKANKEHPGITHYYRLSVNGGEMTKITSQDGGNEVTLSPDEKWLAINHSTMNKPWELYIQANKENAPAKQITKSTSEEFDSYAWMKPDLISFKNRHGDDIYARVYPAQNPHPNKPAVVFVHGAGYLQNVHYWWSQYFREYMFNNMLADNGYTVIDIDYTASSGYGRDHRTGIYRHMGGKDLTDQVDGVKYLEKNYGINPENVGIYGGSYGGFITLMALFNEPAVFHAGAALRSVTDWAHYNHGYTANILNTPVQDPIAYKRSSPIYFAEGLQGHLLMLHGMVDVNVQFQDIVRLNQRLIELGKENWDLAVYPVEDHGFVEPSSWTDEYKRIFKLFERTLKN